MPAAFSVKYTMTHFSHFINLRIKWSMVFTVFYIESSHPILRNDIKSSKVTEYSFFLILYLTTTFR